MNNWQEMETAPRDGSSFILWYAKNKRQYVVYFDSIYEDIGNHVFEFIESYFVVDSPANHTERYTIEENKLTDSYWQPLQTPPQL